MKFLWLLVILGLDGSHIFGVNKSWQLIVQKFWIKSDTLISYLWAEHNWFNFFV